MRQFLQGRKSDHYITPKRVFKAVRKDLNLDLKKMFDPCPYHSKFDNLKLHWMKHNFINPPYSKITEFVTKAFEEWLELKECYLLLPCKTDQRFFHFILEKKFEIYYFNFRIVFENQPKPAPNTHCLVQMN